MYGFLDRPVTDLGKGGQLVIWAARSWICAMAERKCPATAIAPAFATLGVLPALQPFLKVMNLFNRHGLETFQFCALACNHVSEHEAIILTLFDTTDVERCKFSRATLDLLVEADVIDSLIGAVKQVAVTLGNASHAIDAQRGASFTEPVTECGENRPSSSMPPL